MKTTNDVDFFTKKLAAYKRQIDADIAAYSKHVQRDTLQRFGIHSRVATNAYLAILNRGGKRIRGALVMEGYQMMGGKNQAMILQAARAIEMTHAYILMIDDINDRSSVRRNGPTAHTALAEYYKKHDYGSDSEHFGESIAMVASLLGNHAAQMIMANLDVDETLRLNALSILNRGMLITVHGQFNDLFNQVRADVTEKDVDNVTEWKTAHYTFLNPLHIGMILAGADCHATDAITGYAMSLGRAFQLTDDIIGTFGSEAELGKSPLDDMREGKRTLLVLQALKHAPAADKNFLLQMLGNQNITKAEFERCKVIVAQSGALEYTQKQAQKLIKSAITSLANGKNQWSAEGTGFLKGLAEYLQNRTK